MLNSDTNMKTLIKTSAKTLCFGHYSYHTHAVYYPCSSLLISLVLSGDVSECGSSQPRVKSAWVKLAWVNFARDGVWNPLPRTLQPRTPHGNYRIVSRDNMGTKFNYCLFKRFDRLVSKYPESFVQIEKVVRKKINLLQWRGMKPPTANENENLCRYEMQQQLMMAC